MLHIRFETYIEEMYNFVNLLATNLESNSDTVDTKIPSERYECFEALGAACPRSFSCKVHISRDNDNRPHGEHSARSQHIKSAAL